MKKLLYAAVAFAMIAFSVSCNNANNNKKGVDAEDTMMVEEEVTDTFWTIVDGANMSISVVNATDTLDNDTVTYLKDDSTVVIGSINIGKVVKLGFREDGKTLAEIVDKDSIL